ARPTRRRTAAAASWQGASADAPDVCLWSDSRRQEDSPSRQRRITYGLPAALTPPMRMVASRVVPAPFGSVARDSTLYVRPPPPATIGVTPSQPGIWFAAGSPGGSMLRISTI